VSSTYHEEYAEGLLDHARKELLAISAATEINVHEVPGAFEIPLVVQAIARAGNVDAIIAFGLIMEGQTAHATLISTAVTDGLMRIALMTGIPVVHEVLVVINEEQARARCIDDQLNRGTEAARVAMRMAQVMDEFSTEAGR